MEKQVRLCVFCGKSKDNVDLLLGNEQKAICNFCLNSLYNLWNSKISERAIGNDIEEDIENISVIDFTPKSMHEYLNNYIVGQDMAKKILAVSVYQHYLRMSQKKILPDDEVTLKKGNILMIGPTGTGKTLLVQTLANKLKIPFAMADATTLTEAGYVGEDVEIVIKRLLQTCDYDVEKAKYGIIFIDEVDKISRKSEGRSITRDASGEGVQQALLKLIEGTTININKEGRKKINEKGQISIDTSNILFICAGSFEGLDKIISKRLKGNTNLGFHIANKHNNGKLDTSEIVKLVEVEDIIHFGMIPEFVGRFSTICALEPLSVENLKSILVQPKDSLVKQYKKLFQLLEVELIFTDEALDAIASKAFKYKIGARGLKRIVDSLLLDWIYEIPTAKNVTNITIDKSHIDKLEEDII